MVRASDNRSYLLRKARRSSTARSWKSRRTRSSSARTSTTRRIRSLSASLQSLVSRGSRDEETPDDRTERSSRASHSGGGSMQRHQWGLPIRLPVLAALLGLTVRVRDPPAVETAAGATGNGPAVLTGATLMTDGDAPRLLLSGSGRLVPTVFSREGQTRSSVDLADTRPVGRARAAARRRNDPVEARDALVHRARQTPRPVRADHEGLRRSRIGSEPGSTAMAIVLDGRRRSPRPQRPRPGKRPCGPAGRREAPGVSGVAAEAIRPRPPGPRPPRGRRGPGAVRHAASGRRRRASPRSD